MRNWIGLALIALLLTAVPLFGAPPPPGPRASGHWQLVWSSEFNGPAGAPPPAAQWTYDRGNRRGWGNKELENYCAPEDHADPCSARPNIYQDGHGHLVIQARRDAAGRWTSGRLKTQGLYQTSFGRVEARMKLPLGARSSGPAPSNPPSTPPISLAAMACMAKPRCPMALPSPAASTPTA